MPVRTWCTALGIVALSVPLLAQPANLRPGKYEMKTSLKMRGMPPNMPPRTDTSCVTPDQVSDVSKIVHARSDVPDNKCKTSDSKMTGNTLTFTMTCPNLTTISEYTFNGDSFSAVGRMKDAPKDDWIMKVEANRVGECDKE
jgi:hypothetical protein